MTVCGETGRRDLPSLRPVQIPIAALIAGAVVFTLIALAFGGLQSVPGQAPGPGQATAPAPLDVLRLACAALIAGSLMAHPVIRRAQLGVLIRQAGEGDGDDRARLLQAFNTISIIGSALAEGPALFGGVILLLSGKPVDLIFIAIPVLVLIWRFPTAGKWEAFVGHIARHRSLHRPD